MLGWIGAFLVFICICEERERRCGSTGRISPSRPDAQEPRVRAQAKRLVGCLVGWALGAGAVVALPAQVLFPGHDVWGGRASFPPPVGFRVSACRRSHSVGESPPGSRGARQGQPTDVTYMQTFRLGANKPWRPEQPPTRPGDGGGRGAWPSGTGGGSASNPVLRQPGVQGPLLRRTTAIASREISGKPIHQSGLRFCFAWGGGRVGYPWPSTQS
jgi:hypothetical protein